MFKSYGDDVDFTYLKSFGRVKVTYPTSEQAELAQSNLNNHEFQGTSLRTKPVKVSWYKYVLKLTLDHRYYRLYLDHMIVNILCMYWL